MKNQRKKVVIGLSGGVDSSVAALLLKKKGYEVVGVFFKLYSDTKNKSTGECKYLEDLKMARKVAMILEIPLHVLDYEKDYKNKVLGPMFEGYKRGKTPNPDIACNKVIKFPLLLTAARKLEAEYISTGHYARVRRRGKVWELFSGADKDKDQSYFLSDLSQNHLSRTIFPLGHYKKKDVRDIARKEGLPNWDKHGTVGICFVGQDNMRNFLRTKIREKKGRVVMPDGTEIGEHNGAFFYTEGQKAGESSGIKLVKPYGLAQKRFYVVSKDVKKNIIKVAPEGDIRLCRKRINIGKVHMIGPGSSLNGKVCARIRHLGEYHEGKVVRVGGKMYFESDKPISSIASGQIIVFSIKNKVLGCAEIL
ncbi:tRNA 2-thiouridine(34) synthase MnmA [Candidatus Pacearchaeota archaeon]|nr:tRNA 2-thiouridine(34) synthase MnmA [Candidatus Pacearchaeota archaeon]